MAPLASKQDGCDDDDPKAIKARRELQKANKHIMEMAKNEKIGIMRTRRQMQQDRKEAFAELRPQALSERPRTPGELGRAAAALAKRGGSSSCGALLAVSNRKSLLLHGHRSHKASPEESECGGGRGISKREALSRSGSPKAASPNSSPAGSRSPKAEEKKVTLCNLRDVKWFHRSLVRQQVLKQKFDFLYHDMQEAQKRQMEADEEESRRNKLANNAADIVVEPPEGTVEARRRLSDSDYSPRGNASSYDADTLGDGFSSSCSRPLSAATSSYCTSGTAKRSVGKFTSFALDESAIESGNVSQQTSRPCSATEDDVERMRQQMQPLKEDSLLLLPEERPASGRRYKAEEEAKAFEPVQAWSAKPAPPAAEAPEGKQHHRPSSSEQAKGAKGSQAAAFPWRVTPTCPPQPQPTRTSSAQAKGQGRCSTASSSAAGQQQKQCTPAGTSLRRSSSATGNNQRPMRRSASSTACKGGGRNSFAGTASCKGLGMSKVLSVSASMNQLAAELDLEPIRNDYYGGVDCLLHEDILYSSNPRLFPLKNGPSKPFPLLRLAEC